MLRLLDFGAIVQVLPGKDGLLHISQIAKERVNQVSDYVKEGQIVRVKVLEADDKGRAAPVDEGGGGRRRGAGARRSAPRADGTARPRTEDRQLHEQEGAPRAPFFFPAFGETITRRASTFTGASR